MIKMWFISVLWDWFHIWKWINFGHCIHRILKQEEKKKHVTIPIDAQKNLTKSNFQLH